MTTQIGPDGKRHPYPPAESAPAPAPTDDEPTMLELREKARQLEIKGRSAMDRDELEAAIAKAEK
jgi:hypothetical protein